MDNIYRTISIVKQLADGKILKLPCGEIGMGEDMSIGFLYTREDGSQVIGGLATIDLKQLNDLLIKYEVSIIIKD